MSITSLTFFTFLAIVFLTYYALPKKMQWVVLLCASLVFYLFSGIKSILYVLTTVTTTYFATIVMHKITLSQKAYFAQNKGGLSKAEKTGIKAANKRKRKAVMICTLLINFGLLCVFKYFHFALEQINAVISAFGGAVIPDTFRFMIPLGISFYTFQAVGYLVDVYWEFYEPEQNYFKVLLFVSFFPQMTQGPISEFEALSTELFREHTLDYKNYAWGFQRMLWGFFKKMVVADMLFPYVQDVFSNYSQYTGVAVLIGAFMYSVQIYADFSGYMDIMCGFCEMLGIRLTENFDRPYFSKSVAEYWRRWHISLGAWFKKYIYYPIGMSNWSRKFAQNTRKRFGKHFANSVPATLALVLVWLATGLWHGANWAYIAWGGLNGLFIIFSLWMEPVYASWKKALRINESARMWQVFQIIRTFVLVTFIKVLPEVGTLSEGIGLWKQIFFNHDIPHGISQLMPYIDWSDTRSQMNFLLVVAGTVMMFVASVLQRKHPVREYFNRVPYAIRIAVLAGMAVIICSFGVQATWEAIGFLYAQF